MYNNNRLPRVCLCFDSYAKRLEGFKYLWGREKATATPKKMCAGEELERGCRSLLSSWNAAETNKQDNQLGKHRGHECTASPPNPTPPQIKRQMTTTARSRAFKNDARGRTGGAQMVESLLSIDYMWPSGLKTITSRQENRVARAFFFFSRGSLLVYKVCCVCEGRAAWLPAAEVDPWHPSVCLPAPLQSISNSRKKEKKGKEPSVASIVLNWFPFFFLGWQENKKYSAITSSISGINENICTC